MKQPHLKGTLNQFLKGWEKHFWGVMAADVLLCFGDSLFCFADVTLHHKLPEDFARVRLEAYFGMSTASIFLVGVITNKLKDKKASFKKAVRPAPLSSRPTTYSCTQTYIELPEDAKEDIDTVMRY